MKKFYEENGVYFYLVDKTKDQVIMTIDTFGAVLSFKIYKSENRGYEAGIFNTIGSWIYGCASYYAPIIDKAVKAYEGLIKNDIQ